jgi:Zn-dependent M28 family amino/carboxypeptidase
VHNIEAEIVGGARPGEIVIVGAHYDSVVGSPGANDNASGTAAVLALAKRFAGRKCGRTLRFILFTCEEPPYFQSPSMGSAVYARRCRERNENLTAVISLETIGYFTSEPQTQQYPQPFGLFYPSEGDFIAVIGNVGSRKLVREVIESFRRHAEFPSEGGAVPGEITGVGWSDHWSFWQEGYEAVMITDTAPFRYPHYHTADDTPDKLNYDHMARIVDALEPVIDDLVN